MFHLIIGVKSFTFKKKIREHFWLSLSLFGPLTLFWKKMKRCSEEKENWRVSHLFRYVLFASSLTFTLLDLLTKNLDMIQIQVLINI